MESALRVSSRDAGRSLLERPLKAAQVSLRPGSLRPGAVLSIDAMGYTAPLGRAVWPDGRTIYPADRDRLGLQRHHPPAYEDGLAARRQPGAVRPWPNERAM